jgi:hypothetical protein
MKQFKIQPFRFQLSLRIAALACIAIGLLVLVAASYTAVTAAREDAAQDGLQHFEISNFEQSNLPVEGPIPRLDASQASSLPPPKEDPCQHCHIAGENKGIWTPLARWSIFGLAGLVFAFGFYRTTSVWMTRSPWKPISIRAADWVDERYQVKKPLEAVLSKPVPKYALRWWYCLGGITAFLFVVQAVTGIMLAFYYQPTPEHALASIQFIETEVRFGASIRAIHHWAANGMIVMCIAHMLRVFIVGAYKAPRELNWVNGVILLILVLAFGFTGYLLPWDQRAFWATTVGSEIAGSIPVVGELLLIFLRVGWTVSELTLSRFYALHIILLPILTLVMMGLHFLMIRRQGIAQPL